jgi:hypothetical protein
VCDDLYYGSASPVARPWYGRVWNKASGVAVSIGKAAADLPTDPEARSLLVAGLSAGLTTRAFAST